MMIRMEDGLAPAQAIAPNPRRTTPRTTPAATLAVLLTATFMGTFDFFVVNLSAPAIRQDLRASQAQLELVVGSYAFAYASALVPGGRLGDVFGHRRLFVTGMLGFVVTSALCGLAQTPGQLIVARLPQGLTAALMLPQVLAVISTTSDAASRARAMAWYGVAAGLGSIAGQVLGGLLVTADVAGLGWRLIFLVNVPVGVIGAVLAHRILPAPKGRAGQPGGRRWTRWAQPGWPCCSCPSPWGTRPDGGGGHGCPWPGRCRSSPSRCCGSGSWPPGAGTRWSNSR